MASSAAAPARIRETTRVQTESPDPALAQLGSAMRVAESADSATHGAASVAAPMPAYAFPPAAPVRRASASPAVCVCPRCYSPDMAPSRRQTIPVKILATFGVARFRCHSCGKRSWWL